MLSVLNKTSILNTFSNTKCAEIYCQTFDHFSIICTLCELKTFEFQDFLLHFRNVHLDNGKSQDLQSSGVTIKFESEVASAEIAKAESLDLYESFLDIKTLNDSTDSNIENVTLSGDDQVLKEEAKHHDVETMADSDTNSDESIDGSYSHKVFKEPTKKPVQTSEYKCNECKKSYKLSKFLDYHITKCHNRGQIFECQRCERKFSNERTLTSHMQNVHDGFACSQCDKTYKSKEALQLHFFNHSGIRNFICDVDNCNKAFFNPKSLSNHKRMVHTLDRNYVCEMCGFRTKAKPALIVHKRSHTGEKPFACKDCDRRFASQSLLGEHKAMHLADRPHKCEVCGATFARHKALYHHKHLHLGIKKFLCKICGKSYAQAAGLSGHMRQHKSEQF